MKFLSIVASNLDEFFMIRVASLWDLIDAGYDRVDASGMTPKQQIAAITARVRVMIRQMYEVLKREILPALNGQGVFFLSADSMTDRQRKYLDDFFEKQVYPVLTPMAVDATRPFPLIFNRSLNLGVLIDGGEGEDPVFATVQVPAGLPRVIEIKDAGGTGLFLMEALVALFIDRLFAGQRVLCCYPYRITRNSDMNVDEEDSEDLLVEIERLLKQRRWGAAVRLEIEYGADARLVKILEDALELEGGDAYPIDGPINLDFLLKYLYDLPGFERLKYAPFAARELSVPDGETLFDGIRKGDILIYHPYDSFNAVVRFVREAVRDPHVLAIKQTLYRVSGDSPIIAALSEAADAGKQVTVLLELKARFDEENNIHWGKRLERAGAHVIYGMAGLKTHSKITLVVRREQGGVRRYVHLGTGNYNDVTAKIYTDHGLFTANDQIGADASAFFNMLTGYSQLPKLNKLICAPRDLRGRFLHLIEREENNAREGKRAEIFLKMNALVDEAIIARLYSASRAGVRIRMIVRGICCLRPGMPGLSENITVRSIVGRFLEHSRIYVFYNGGRQEVYLSSADLMPRNLDRRVELMFPVEHPALGAELVEGLKLQWRDNVKIRELASDGHYERVRADGRPVVNAQEALLTMHTEGTDAV
jgi:polyphosphate kinase